MGAIMWTLKRLQNLIMTWHKAWHKALRSSTPFPHLWGKNSWEPIFGEYNLWFASFEGGKSGGRVSWWENIWWFSLPTLSSSHPHFFLKIGSLPTKRRKGLLMPYVGMHAGACMLWIHSLCHCICTHVANVLLLGRVNIKIFTPRD